MPTATKETTVQELIQELQNFPSDAPVSLKDGLGETFSVAGFEAGSDSVTIIISEYGDDYDDDESSGGQ
ncbi:MULTISPECIES: hypothetical protein [unclassified Nostoc]|uniref:hypothetical protein n=1 Tax=unclassified Nostoc TaxID=2593658 RepID=UPI00263534FD|nr:hypothetical protein [Nostoc sp. S13]MDF5736796.1 hypothetical protein [Nostoc sp. S13]